MRKRLTNKGFTLVEILLYFAIISVILFAIMSFSLQILDLAQKSTNLKEIQTNMDYIGNKITYTIKSAESVDAVNSTFDNDTGKLSLITTDPSDSPTSFYVQNEEIFIKQGSASAVKVSSDLISCPQLRFSRITSTNIPDQILIDIRCEPVNLDINQQLVIQTLVSLRK